MSHYYILKKWMTLTSKLQKQMPAVILEHCYSERLRKVHREKAAVKSCFKKINIFQRRSFSENVMHFLK